MSRWSYASQKQSNQSKPSSQHDNVSFHKARSVIPLVLRVAANRWMGWVVYKEQATPAPGNSLGSPFLFFKLVEQLHLLPVSCFHHCSQLVHLGLQFQDMLGKARRWVNERPFLTETGPQKPPKCYGSVVPLWAGATLKPSHGKMRSMIFNRSFSAAFLEARWWKPHHWSNRGQFLSNSRLLGNWDSHKGYSTKQKL